MKQIPAFETPDKKRFFNEDEARTHERRYDFSNLVDSAVRGDAKFARLDRELLLDFLTKHGSTAGKLADAAILPERLHGSFTPADGRPMSYSRDPALRSLDDGAFDAELEEALRGQQ